MMIEHNHSRRNFLKTGLAATLGTSAGWAQASPPARKLRIAGVGIGGMGGANLGNVADEEIVALCDVDHAFAAGTFGKFPQAKRWRDFREMLEKQPEIEAVMIATPDHTHAAIALAPSGQPPRGSRLHPHAPPTGLGIAGLTAKYGKLFQSHTPCTRQSLTCFHQRHY